MGRICGGIIWDGIRIYKILWEEEKTMVSTGEKKNLAAWSKGGKLKKIKKEEEKRDKTVPFSKTEIDESKINPVRFKGAHGEDITMVKSAPTDIKTPIRKKQEEIISEKNISFEGKIGKTNIQEDILGLTASPGLPSKEKGTISPAFATEGIGARAIGEGRAVISSAKNQRTVEAISRGFKISSNKVNKIIENRLLDRKIDDIVNEIDPKKLALGTKIAIGGGIIGLGTTIAGADQLISWYALDNVIGGVKFQSNNILSAAKENAIDEGKAMELLDEGQEKVNLAKSKVRSTTMLNPLVYAYGKFILAGMEGDQEAIDLNRIRIKKFFESKREEFNIGDKEQQSL